MKNIILVGSQDEVYESLIGWSYNLYVIQPENLIGDALRRAAKEIYPIPAWSECHVLQAAHRIVEKRNIDYIFSFTEYGLLPAARAAAQLHLPGIRLDIADLCINKAKLRDKLIGTKFGIPFHLCIRKEQLLEFSAKVGFPIVLKDPSGVGSINVKVCHTMTEAIAQWSTMIQKGYDSVLAEKYVSGDEFSVETLSIDSVHEVIGLTRKTLHNGSLVEKQHFFPVDDISKTVMRRVHTYIQDLLDAIGFIHGPAHIEIKIDGEDINLIEINNRCGGDFIWEMVYKVKGVDIVKKTIETALHGHSDQQEKLVTSAFGAMAYIALFNHVNVNSLRAMLEKTIRVYRISCDLKYDDSVPITNSFSRAGYVLIGDISPQLLREKLPVVQIAISDAAKLSH